MKTSKLLVYGFVAFFSLCVFAQDSDFGDEAPAVTPATDVNVPPSGEGDYNKDLTDAVGNEEPKVPQPESNTVKPVIAKPHSASTKKDPAAMKPKKKEKKDKKDKKEKKAKAEKTAGKKEKAGKKDKKAGKKSDRKSDKKSNKKSDKKSKKKPAHSEEN